MSDKITFRELVDLIAKQSNQSQSSTNSFIGELVSIIESGLRDSGSVSISGFGKFELRWMKERPGVNPQTGEKLTIPGQNKVVFKPYKALREDVNRPYANMKAQILDESPGDSDESSGKKPAGEPEAEEKPAEKPTPFPPAAESSEDGDAYLIERPSPAKTRKKPKKETEQKPAPPAEKKTEKKEEPPAEKEPKKPFTPVPVSTGRRSGDAGTAPEIDPVEEAKLTNQVKESGSMKWSYTAAAVVVALAVFIIFLISQQNNSDTTSEITSSPDQITAPASPDVTDRLDETETTPEPEEVTATDRETEIHQVEEGESLWSIAETELGNPYLWPMIYNLNKEVIENPNVIPESAELTIPVISEPENLSETHLEEVAQGYLSLYEWTKNNNPDEAKYFLWAVGTFSTDVLELAASRADSADLAFARTR